MARSMNGWPASPDLPLRPLVVAGVPFVPGIRDDDDVATVLGYVVTEYAKRVEQLATPGCWGFAFRPNVNAPNSLSNHSSGTAVDVNAPFHPNGVRTTATFTAGQIAAVHRILAEVDHAVRWGGDFAGTPDAMHFEVNVTPAELATVATRIRTEEEANMPLNEADKEAIRAIVHEEIAAIPETVRVPSADGTTTQKLGPAWQRLLKAVKG